MSNGFYSVATDVLSRSAIIDKMVGDQVMALYLPLLLPEHWEDEMLRDASELLARICEIVGLTEWPPRERPPHCRTGRVAAWRNRRLLTWTS
jgi:hypothetical protein